LRAVSKALQEVEIFCQSFTNVLGHAQAGDFVYFDPPYAPLSKTANFTAYQAEGFTSKAQEQLRDLCVELTNRNIQFMLSNSATETIRELYSISPFMIEEVQANRAINSNRNGRGKLQEFIITNYTAHERKLSFFERAQDST
jgi:DNA adenine methylase